jgi:FkbM family methyltransferase
MILAARSFLHGSPRLHRTIAPLARPLLRHIPGLQKDPALTALERFALTSGETMFVQLGAHDGLANDPIHDLVISRDDWSGVVVEPVPEHYAALRATYAEAGDRVRFERAVVGASCGQVPFYRFRDAPDLPAAMRQVGSLSRAHVERYADELDSPDLVVTEEKVPSTTLPALLLRHGVSRIDILHMDIEGAEPIVLSQIDFAASWAPKTLLFEHNHLPAAELKYWKSRLRAVGYRLEHGRLDTWAEREEA